MQLRTRLEEVETLLKSLQNEIGGSSSSSSSSSSAYSLAVLSRCSNVWIQISDYLPMSCPHYYNRGSFCNSSALAAPILTLRQPSVASASGSLSSNTYLSLSSSTLQPVEALVLCLKFHLQMYMLQLLGESSVHTVVTFLSYTSTACHSVSGAACGSCTPLPQCWYVLSIRLRRGCPKYSTGCPRSLRNQGPNQCPVAWITWTKGTCSISHDRQADTSLYRYVK